MNRDTMVNMFASPPCSMPDKDSDIFGQSYIDPCKDLFDQFLDLDSLDSESSILPNPSTSTLLVRPRGSFADSAGTVRDEHARHRRASIGAGLDYKQNAASPQQEFFRDNSYRDGSCKAAISDTELLSLEGIHLHSSSPTPHTPSLQTVATYPLTPATTGRRHRILDIPGSRGRKASTNHRRTSLHHTKTFQDHSPIRKITSPAKMMRARQYSEQTLREWSQKLAEEAKNFQFDFQSSPLSPPPSARVSDASADSHGISQIAGQQSIQGFMWDNQMPQFGSRNHQAELHSPISTPQDVAYSFQPPHHRQQNQHRPSPNSSNGMLSSNTITQTAPQTHNTPWGPHSHSTLATDYVFSTSGETFHDANDADTEADSAPVWWGHTSTAPVIQSSPAMRLPPNMDQRRNMTPNHNQHPSQSIALQLQSELAYNGSELAMDPASLPSHSGLMIQGLPASPQGQSFVVIGGVQGPEVQQHPYFSQHRNMSPQDQHPYHHRQQQLSYPEHSEDTGFGALEVRKSRRGGNRSEGEGPEDSPSPTSGTASSTSTFRPSKQQQRRATPHRNHSYHDHHSHPAVTSSRAKSSSHPPSRASSRGASKSNSMSSGSGISKSGTNRSKSSGGGAVDFVNFTPSDSMKILTGVAPSGSSKTKARREREAMEKRRRLSLAAVRAVEAAGGSIEGLLSEEEEAGLLG